MAKALWSPDPEKSKETLLCKFAERASTTLGLELSEYDDIWDWSVKDKPAFWGQVWDFCGVIGSNPKPVLENEADVKEARFFPQARLNYAENLLKRKGPEQAIVFHGEAGDLVVWSWDELHAQVSLIQQALRAENVGIGDRVAGFVPNSPYAIAAMLATASLGAVWSSGSPDFGYNGINDRFGQIEPKVLFAAQKYQYNGKEFECLETAERLADALGSVQKLVVFPYADEPVGTLTGAKSVSWADFGAEFTVEQVEYVPVPFDAPLYILFSSGTTGLPKCIVHSVGGILLQHLKEHQLHSDICPGDRFFYFTTCGWMMWNWLVSGLASGATLILFDGSPFYPDGNRLSEIAAQEKVTQFGTSAKYIDACAKGGIAPAKAGGLDALRTIFSTGSPLAPDSFDYIYRDWKADVCLSSIAGGTDICGCFTGGSPISPVYRGQCQKRLLGMDVQVFDDQGQAQGTGAGELVCVGPHPSQPVGFWNDPDGSRYHNAYFAKFENVWHHGDFVEITPEGGAIFHGRSDAVLNPGGVRIGTAEIYRQVERVEQVLEAMVIGQTWDNDVRVVLFVRLREGVALDDSLKKRIKSEIRTHATPRHVPAIIIAVDDIPRTKSGKITELAVRDVVHGRAVKNTGSMANPEALALFEDLPELAV
ncbi:acetoacetate-CoA ligase [Amylibacter marinus]|uniref:Acetoacetate-CoA ligase n=1 Tax=Amylibacter marinus TaxID=1475483 RepID=A0ABQ5VQW6_9RHOB|nr:acetoacetate--CoA ligase [Amylibacter marinus]GLQ33800.1 acetoacetate-CoA ligase [Amylibacter marinus]